MGVAVVGKPLHHGRAHAPHAHPVLNGNHAFEVASYLVQQFLVERFKKTQVVVRYAQSRPGSFGHADGFSRLGANGAQGDDGSISALLELAAPAYGNLLERAVPVTIEPRPRG